MVQGARLETRQLIVYLSSWLPCLFPAFRLHLGGQEVYFFHTGPSCTENNDIVNCSLLGTILQLSFHIAELISIALVLFPQISFYIFYSEAKHSVKEDPFNNGDGAHFFYSWRGDEIYKYLTGLKAVRYLCNFAFARLSEPIIPTHIWQRQSEVGPYNYTVKPITSP